MEFSTKEEKAEAIEEVKKALAEAEAGVVVEE